ncbi:MAG: FAD:protein FMN transferase [Candidatus Methylomirabilis oxygeniifera]|uniref:FAD:protein FMN transferase n=1 Tax=Methylomirabilis oxygeniifera TaxID=671143 RepID=D5MLS1_METO1|nr:MAG: FAD:protein FMN transferase [Candidatus Methylomirabilis oxyfera]CBE69978.1 putative THIAMINE BIOSYNTHESIS LIPOPROTEIN APBE TRANSMEMBRANE (modular protein) [Candidatus Methylomirabilis oxyfera]
MSRRDLTILDECGLSRRRFLAAIAGGAGGMLFGLLSPGTARGNSKMRTLTLGRVLMGTVVEIEANHPDPSIARSAIEAGLQRMENVDRLMTVFRYDSEIGLVNRVAATRAVAVGQETFTVLTEAERIGLTSGGAFDVTIHPLVQLWHGTTKEGRLPSSQAIEATLGLVGHDGLSLDPDNRSVRLQRAGMGIDLGGIAKGYAVDVAAETLRHDGVHGGLIDAGGDLRVVGRNRDGDIWKIGLRHPLASSRLLLSVLVEDAAVATSGNYFRYVTVDGRQYGHLLHPRAGTPADTALSATVIARSAIRADALATAAMVHGTGAMDFIQRVRGVEGIVVNPLARHPEKVSVQITPGLRGRVELLDRFAELEG